MYLFLFSQVEYADISRAPLCTMRESLTDDIEDWAESEGLTPEEYLAPYKWLEDNRIDHHYTVRLFKPDRYDEGHAVFLCVNADHTVVMEFILRFGRRPFEGTCGQGWLE